MKNASVVVFSLLLVLAFASFINTANASRNSSLMLSSSSNAFNARQAMVGTPKKVIYIDYQGINWNAPQDTVTQAVDAGYNVIILAFYLTNTPADMCQAWAGVSQSDQQQAIDYAHSKNAIVIVSAGGATCSPYSTLSGSDYGTQAAQWAVDNNLDGVDFDMENFGSPLVAPGLDPSQTIQWLADAVNAARSVLGDNRVITGAPQAPYFGKIGGGGGNPWTGASGGYTAVYQASTTTDWYNVQFYNQGSSCYVDYQGLFIDSSSCAPFPGTSVQEIASYGIPLEKIVVGKYLQGGASNGYVDPSTLGQYFTQAQSQIGWDSGVMAWVWVDQATNTQWISEVYPN